MRAVNYYIVVEKIKSEPKKVAGLLIKDEESRYSKGKVITIGNLVQGAVSYTHLRAHET